MLHNSYRRILGHPIAFMLMFTAPYSHLLAQNTVPPKISAIASDVLPAGTSKIVFFTVAEAEKNSASETAIDMFTATATSSNQAIVPNAGILVRRIQNTGWQAVVTPSPTATGTTTITITAKDDGVPQLSHSMPFTLTYTAANNLPIATGLSRAIVKKTGDPLAQTWFTVTDETAANLLTFNKSIDSTAIISATSAITIGYQGAASGTHLMTVNPKDATSEGASLVTIAPKDAQLDFNNYSFVYGRHDPTAPHNTSVNRPFGLWVLDSDAGAMTSPDGTPLPYSFRDANIVPDEQYIDGYVLRVSWAESEPEDNKFDFQIIDNAMAQLGDHQRLSMIILGDEPTYMTSKVNDPHEWADTADNPRGPKDIPTPYLRPVPWADNLLVHRRRFIEALANHEIDGIRLGEHPRLAVVNPYLAGGHAGVRDPNGQSWSALLDKTAVMAGAVSVPISDSAGFTREALLNAVLSEIQGVKLHFPNVLVNFGFFPVADDTAHQTGLAPDSLTDYLLAGVLAEGGVALFQDNLAANRATLSGSFTGLPLVSTLDESGSVVDGIGAPLVDAKDFVGVSFQMLGSWTAPASTNHAVNNRNGSVSDGIDYAFNTFRARYFELYSPDVDSEPVPLVGSSEGANISSDVRHGKWRAWHDYLAGLAAATGINTAPFAKVSPWGDIVVSHTTAIDLFVGDHQTLPGNLTVMATVDNTAAIPSIAVSGSGVKRALTFTPSDNSAGQSATLTITVSDGSLTTTLNLPLSIFPPAVDPDVPVISPIPNQSRDNGTEFVLKDDRTIIFTVSDDEIATISAPVVSSAGTFDLNGIATPLFLSANMTLAQVTPGNNTAWSLRLRPNKNIPSNIGILTATITVSVTDAQGNVDTTSFLAEIDTSRTR